MSKQTPEEKYPCLFKPLDTDSPEACLDYIEQALRRWYPHPSFPDDTARAFQILREATYNYFFTRRDNE